MPDTPAVSSPAQKADTVPYTPLSPLAPPASEFQAPVPPFAFRVLPRPAAMGPSPPPFSTGGSVSVKKSSSSQSSCSTDTLPSPFTFSFDCAAPTRSHFPFGPSFTNSHNLTTPEQSVWSPGTPTSSALAREYKNDTAAACLADGGVSTPFQPYSPSFETSVANPSTSAPLTSHNAVNLETLSSRDSSPESVFHSIPSTTTTTTRGTQWARPTISTATESAAYNGKAIEEEEEVEEGEGFNKTPKEIMADMKSDLRKCRLVLSDEAREKLEKYWPRDAVKTFSNSTITATSTPAAFTASAGVYVAGTGESGIRATSASRPSTSVTETINGGTQEEPLTIPDFLLPDKLYESILALSLSMEMHAQACRRYPDKVVEETREYLVEKAKFACAELMGMAISEAKISEEGTQRVLDVVNGVLFGNGGGVNKKADTNSTSIPITLFSSTANQDPDGTTTTATTHSFAARPSREASTNNAPPASATSAAPAEQAFFCQRQENSGPPPDSYGAVPRLPPIGGNLGQHASFSSFDQPGTLFGSAHAVLGLFGSATTTPHHEFNPSPASTNSYFGMPPAASTTTGSTLPFGSAPYTSRGCHGSEPGSVFCVNPEYGHEAVHECCGEWDYFCLDEARKDNMRREAMYPTISASDTFEGMSTEMRWKYRLDKLSVYDRW